MECIFCQIIIFGKRSVYWLYNLLYCFVNSSEVRIVNVTGTDCAYSVFVTVLSLCDFMLLAALLVSVAVTNLHVRVVR